MNPTNKPVTISLQGDKFKLYFDLNTFSAFEDETGRFFLDFIVELQEAITSLAMKQVAESNGANPSTETVAATPTTALQFLRKVPIKQLRAFIWAALHTYDKHGEPVWPMTVGQLGARIDHTNIMELIPAIMKGSKDNLPEPKAGVSDEEEQEEDPRPMQDHSLQESGGIEHGPSDDDVLALMTEK